MHLGAALVELGRGDETRHGQQDAEILLEVHHAGCVTRLVYGDKLDLGERRRRGEPAVPNEVGVAVRQTALVAAVKIAALLEQSEVRVINVVYQCTWGYAQEQAAKVAVVHLQAHRLRLSRSQA